MLLELALDPLDELVGGEGVELDAPGQQEIDFLRRRAGTTQPVPDAFRCFPGASPIRIRGPMLSDVFET